MAYRFLLFDIDDTLLDFKAGEMKSLREMFAELQLPRDPRLEPTYLRINQSLWEAYERGDITREDIFRQRFVKTFKHLQINADGLLAERVYETIRRRRSNISPRGKWRTT